MYIMLNYSCMRIGQAMSDLEDTGAPPNIFYLIASYLRATRLALLTGFQSTALDDIFGRYEILCLQSLVNLF
jgi:hypothetical protein